MFKACFPCNQSELNPNGDQLIPGMLKVFPAINEYMYDAIGTVFIKLLHAYDLSVGADNSLVSKLVYCFFNGL